MPCFPGGPGGPRKKKDFYINFLRNFFLNNIPAGP